MFFPFIVFQQPVWFLLLIPLVCVLWIWRINSRLITILRSISVLLVVFALCGPMLQIPTQSGTVVAVVDLSRSMPDDASQNAIGAINLITNHSSQDDKVGVVSFAGRAFPERIPGPKQAFSNFISETSRDSSDLHSAIDLATSLIPHGEKGRIVLFTDGKYTGESPLNLASRLIQRGIAIDYRLLERTNAGDIAIGMLEAPQLVSPREAFTIGASVYVPVSQDVDYELLRDDVVINSGRRSMNTGDNRLVFRDRAASIAGNHTYTLKINGELTDPISENNTARRIVGVDGTKPLLVLAQKDENGNLLTQIPALFNAAGIDSAYANAQNLRFSLTNLSSYSGIVLENVPASDIGNSGMELIAEWVKQSGSGLLFTGGKSAYALGGYFKS
ncbi:MAG: vWA domain-containing protein, partial [Thermoguttaceae bacterium]